MNVKTTVCTAGRRVRRFVCGVAPVLPVVWGLVCAGAAASADPAVLPAVAPPWHVAEASIRRVFPVAQTDGSAWIRFPRALADGSVVTSLHAVAAGALFPVRVSEIDAEELRVDIGVSGVPTGTDLAVYGVVGDRLPTEGILALGPPFPDDVPSFVAPIRVAVYRVRGQDAADSAERMRWIWARREGASTRFSLAEFADVDGGGDAPPQWFRPDWTRRFYVANLRVHFHQRGTRRGRPAVRSPNATTVWLDGRPVLEYPAAYSNHSEWAVGDWISVPSGVRELDLFDVCDQNLQVRFGWLWEGETNVTLLSSADMLPGDAAVSARTERIDAMVHPDARFEPRPMYRLHGIDTDFYPVVLRDHSRSWTGSIVSRTWHHAGAMLGSAETLRHVFHGRGPHPVALQVVDSLGFRAESAITVAPAAAPVAEYRLSVWWEGFPAVAFDVDLLRPELRLQGDVPDSVDLVARVVVVDRDGGETLLTSSLVLRDTWARLVLPPMRVSDFEAVDWDVRHAGRIWRQGRVRRVAPPFDAFPDGINGDALFHGSEQWVLSPRQAPAAESSPLPDRSSLRILWLDSTVIAEGHAAWELLEADDASLPVRVGHALGADGVSYVHWNELAGETRGAGVSVSLVSLARLPKADLVLLSLGFEALQTGEPPAAFQRRLAAVVGLLRDVRRVPLVLMTPLPYVRGDMPDTMRPYAEAVHRVAAAHGIPVVDLYSTFRALAVDDADAVLRGMRLTEAGRRHLIARLLAALAVQRPSPGDLQP